MKKNANDLLILKGGKAVDINGNLLETDKIDEITLDEKIKNSIKGMALTAKQIKEKINYDIDTRKIFIIFKWITFCKKR